MAGVGRVTGTLAADGTLGSLGGSERANTSIDADDEADAFRGGAPVEPLLKRIAEEGIVIASHGAESIVAAQTLIPEGMVVPPGSLVMGVPGRILRILTEEEVESIRKSADGYVKKIRLYLDPASH